MYSHARLTKRLDHVTILTVLSVSIARTGPKGQDMWQMKRGWVAAAAILTSTLLGFTAMPAEAAVGDVSDIPNTSACSGVASDVGITPATGSFLSGKYQEFGESIPIILVHGNDGKDDRQWGSISEAGSIASQLNAVSNVKVAVEFQYDVTGSPIDGSFTSHFRPLANTIDCISRMSVDNGGRGKVIVIGYSEGSAIAHGASALSTTDGTRHISDEIGLAVTVADARSVYPYSIDSPDFGYQTSVFTVAGDVTNNVVDAWGDVTSSTDTQSDGYIQVADATSGHTSDTTRGGGGAIITCIHSFNSVGDPVETLSDHSCDHGNLLSNDDSKATVVGAVEAYQSAQSASLVTSGNIEAGPLSMPLVEDWTAGGPSSWSGVTTSWQTNFENNFHSCTYDAPEDRCYEGVSISYNPGYTDASACIGDGPSYTTITIDGVTSTCSIRGYSYIFWYFDSKKTRIRYDLAATDGTSPSVMSLISSATWTS